MRHAEKVIAARFDVAWLAVVAGNARARRFYERSGWRDAGGFDYAAEIAGGTILVPVSTLREARQAVAADALRTRLDACRGVGVT